MMPLHIAAALAAYSAMSLTLGLLGLAMDKLRLPARWRLWKMKFKGACEK